MQVVLVLPTGVTAFEALGPFGVFARTSDCTLRLLGDRAGRVPCHGSKVPLVAEASYLYVEPEGVADVLVVPGGMGVHGLVGDEVMLDWLRVAHASASWTIGISTGTVLLAAAGLLDDQDATTHWLATEMLDETAAHAVSDRLVVGDGVVTATGAVAGLDAALHVVADLRGQDEAAAVRAHLGDDLAGRLAETGPVGADVLDELTDAGSGSGSGTSPLFSAVSARGNVSRRQRRRAAHAAQPRWSRRSGRIQVTDSSRSD